MNAKYKKVEISFEEYQAIQNAGGWATFKINYALQEGRPYSDSITFYTRVEQEQDTNAPAI